MATKAKSGKERLVPSYVLIDEAHHCASPSYRALWNIWSAARMLGVTATPCRLKKMNFGELFDSLIISWQISQFIKEGWLSLFDYVTVTPESEAMQKIGQLEKRGADGDYQMKEMHQVLNNRASIEQLYYSYKKYASGRQGIIYAINREHASHIRDYYEQRGESIMLIDALTPLNERNKLMEAYHKGEINIFVNCEIAGEGIDVPNVSFIQMARPTLSLTKYMQQIGRGMRPNQGKQNCIILDNVGMYYRFGLPNEDRDWAKMFRIGQNYSDSKSSLNRTRYTPFQGNLDEGHEDPMVVILGSDELYDSLHESNEPYTIIKEGDYYGLRQGKDIIIPPKYYWITDIVDNFVLVCCMQSVRTNTGELDSSYEIKSIELPSRRSRSISSLSCKYFKRPKAKDYKDKLKPGGFAVHDDFVEDLKSRTLHDNLPDEIVTFGFMEFSRFGEYYVPRIPHTKYHENRYMEFRKEQLEGFNGDVFQKESLDGRILFAHKRFPDRGFILEGYKKEDVLVKVLFEPSTGRYWHYKKDEELTLVRKK